MKCSVWDARVKDNRCARAGLFGFVFLLVGVLLAGTALISCDLAGVSGGGGSGSATENESDTEGDSQEEDQGGSGSDGQDEDQGSTPIPPLYVDDFEDGDWENAISVWRNMFDSLSTTQTFYGIDAAGDGNHTMRLAMNMPTDQPLQPNDPNEDTFWENSGLNTGPTSTANAIDVTGYTNLAFSLSFAGSYSGSPHHSDGYLNLYIYMTGNGGTIKYPLFEDTSFTDFMHDFTEYVIPLDDFDVNVGSLAELKQAIEQIMFSVWLSGDDDDAVSYELILDEVRFEE
jgi:hypothetical protein